jgi:hypothetical protein
VVEIELYLPILEQLNVRHCSVRRAILSGCPILRELFVTDFNEQVEERAFLTLQDLRESVLFWAPREKRLCTPEYFPDNRTLEVLSLSGPNWTDERFCRRRICCSTPQVAQSHSCLFCPASTMGPPTCFVACVWRVPSLFFVVDVNAWTFVGSIPAFSKLW